MRELMKRVIVEIEKGLSKKTHPDADIKCFVTYVQDLPNGKGNFCMMGFRSSYFPSISKYSNTLCINSYSTFAQFY